MQIRMDNHDYLFTRKKIQRVSSFKTYYLSEKEKESFEFFPTVRDDEESKKQSSEDVNIHEDNEEKLKNVAWNLQSILRKKFNIAETKMNSYEEDEFDESGADQDGKC